MMEDRKKGGDFYAVTAQKSRTNALTSLLRSQTGDHGDYRDPKVSQFQVFSTQIDLIWVKAKVGL